MLFSLNTDDWIGDNLTDAVANYTNLFHLHRIVKNVLFDDSLWQIELGLKEALDLV